MYNCVYIDAHTHIYIDTHRQREIYTHTYINININIYIHTLDKNGSLYDPAGTES